MKTTSEAIRVDVISIKGESVLVQFVDDGKLLRRYVPASKLAILKNDATHGLVHASVLSYAIPYGFAWEDVTLEFDTIKFANELRNLGIWTAADALKNPNGLWSALRAGLADTLSKILVEARNDLRRK